MVSRRLKGNETRETDTIAAIEADMAASAVLFKLLVIVVLRNGSVYGLLDSDTNDRTQSDDCPRSFRRTEVFEPEVEATGGHLSAIHIRHGLRVSNCAVEIDRRNGLYPAFCLCRVSGDNQNYILPLRRL